jgi:uridine kinase
MVGTSAAAMEQIVLLRKKVSSERAILIGISGIDGSGKGYIAEQLFQIILKEGYKAVTINTDGWLNLPQIRFNRMNPAQNFYDRAFRFEEMFERLILPLKRNRSIDLISDYTKETANDFLKHEYHFENVDVILLEGIFLFKEVQREHFDLAVWIECSFESALKRAIQRKQEGLSNEETVQAYEEIYFPAQRIHIEKDQPQLFADIRIENDKNAAG